MHDEGTYLDEEKEEEKRRKAAEETREFLEKARSLGEAEERKMLIEEIFHRDRVNTLQMYNVTSKKVELPI